MPESRPDADAWLALVVGNTRLHWATVRGDRLLTQWHTRHLTPSEVNALVASGFAPPIWATYQAGNGSLPTQPLGPIPLYAASVVPAQSQLWMDYPRWHPVTLGAIPVGNLYGTLGIDRALNLWAAGSRYGWPVLVVDAGTALTFTAGDQQALVGGAILPGIRLQFQALGAETAALPHLDLGTAADGGQGPTRVGDRWATDTANAIRSGIGHGILATVQDYLTAWTQTYPHGSVVLTGGDGGWIYAQLQQRLGDRPAFAVSSPDLMARSLHSLSIYHCPDLTFWGLQQYRAKSLASAEESTAS